MKKYQLFIVPYAGGNADAFTVLGKYMPEEIELVCLDYAGHGTRRKENFYPTFDDMVKDMAEQINACRKPELETVIFGYSMGSVVVYEMLAHQLVHADVKQVFLAAHEAPGELWDCEEYVKLGDLEFAHKLMELGGFDRFEERFLKNRYFRKVFFEPIREDYRLLADYSLKHETVLDIEAVFFFAPQDIPRENMMKWKKWFQREPQFVEIGRNHFFIKEFPEELTGRMKEALDL